AAGRLVLALRRGAGVQAAVGLALAGPEVDPQVLEDALAVALDRALPVVGHLLKQDLLRRRVAGALPDGPDLVRDRRLLQLVPGIHVQVAAVAKLPGALHAVLVRVDPVLELAG